jgi:hypothetical protein
MHLVSLRDASFDRLALDAGWNVEKRWMSPAPAFGTLLLA